MKINTLWRISKLGLTNFKRNGWLSFIATLILTLTLLIISVFIIFNIVINSTTQAIKEKIDLAAYFKIETSEEQARYTQDKLKLLPEIKSITFISKDEALDRWNDLKISQKVKEQISKDNNPLPMSLDIKTNQSEDLEKIANILSSDEYAPLIERVSYQENKDIIDKLVSITKFSKKIGFTLGLIFSLISVLVILNTVRLTIYTRSKEIEIMRLVGANDVFVRFPFLIEAFLYSLLATIISLFLIWLGLHFITPMITKYIGDVNLNLEGYLTNNLLAIFIYELILSTIVTVACSIIGIRKHIKI